MISIDLTKPIPCKIIACDYTWEHQHPPDLQYYSPRPSVAVPTTRPNLEGAVLERSVSGGLISRSVQADRELAEKFAEENLAKALGDADVSMSDDSDLSELSESEVEDNEMAEDESEADEGPADEEDLDAEDEDETMSDVESLAETIISEASAQTLTKVDASEERALIDQAASQSYIKADGSPKLVQVHKTSPRIPPRRLSDIMRAGRERSNSPGTPIMPPPSDTAPEVDWAMEYLSQSLTDELFASPSESTSDPSLPSSVLRRSMTGDLSQYMAYTDGGLSWFEPLEGPSLAEIFQGSADALKITSKNPLADSEDIIPIPSPPRPTNTRPPLNHLPAPPRPTHLPKQTNACRNQHCPLRHLPHFKGMFLQNGKIPKKWNEDFGWSDPPRRVWDAWVRVEDLVGSERDFEIVRGFAASHFWTGEEVTPWWED